MEVKGATARIIEPVLDSEFDQVVRGQIVRLVQWIVLAEAALIAGDEVLIFGHTCGEPAVPRGGLQIPDLMAVDEADTEAFRHAVLGDQSTKALYSLTGGADVG